MNQNQLPIRLQNRPNSPSGVLPHQRILHYHNLVTMLFHHGVLTTATVADDSVRGKYGFLGHSDNHIRGSQRGTAGSPRELCPGRLDNALLSRIGRNPEDVRLAGPAHRSSLELCWRRRLRMASEYFRIARNRSVRAERSCALLLQIEGAPHGWGKGGALHMALFLVDRYISGDAQHVVLLTSRPSLLRPPCADQGRCVRH